MASIGEVNDRSGIIVKVGLFDSTDTPITVTAGTWTLVTDDDTATVINSRLDVELPTRNADNYYYIGLTGDDTAFDDGAGRYLVVEAQYYNTLTESVMDIKEFCTFEIVDLRHIV